MINKLIKLGCVKMCHNKLHFSGFRADLLVIKGNEKECVFLVDEWMSVVGVHNYLVAP